jgi:peptidoglycan/xylan/chitin deacetylase (PgdA/CDA1 family)
MTPATALYRPSLLDLARAGNLQAIAHWMNSLLGPQGITVQLQSTRSGTLNLVIQFHRAQPRGIYLQAKTRLVKFICYRLWTLNSAAIYEVRIAARMAGQSTVLWQEAVRIKTSANASRIRRRTPAWTRFQILRSAFLNRFAFAGFVLCYWLLHWELSSRPTKESLQASASTLPPASVPTLLYKEGQLSAGITTAKQDYPQLPPISAAPQEFVGKVVHSGELADNQKVVALTFDDGPWETSTEQVLDILKQNNIHATFYMVGQQLQKHPDLARLVAAGGHALGNHTWRHPIADLDLATAAQEVGNTARLIYQITGIRTNLFRPPGGNLTGELVPYAQRQRYSINLWSVESNDYYLGSPLIVDNVLRGVKPGSIVLMHDGGGDRAATIQALPQIITALRQRGYRFVTVPELLALQSRTQAIAAAKAKQAAEAEAKAEAEATPSPAPSPSYSPSPLTFNPPHGIVPPPAPTPR